MPLPFAALSSLTGGGGLSLDGGDSGPATSGPINTGGFSFGGINTGTQSSVPPYVWPAVWLFAGVLLFTFIKRR